MQSKINLLIFYSLFLAFISYSEAYYGDPNSLTSTQLLIQNGAAGIKNTVYIMGGYAIETAEINTNVTTISFDDNNDPTTTILNPTGDRLACYPCSAYTLNDSTIVAMGASYFPASETELPSIGLAFYNVQSNSFRLPQNISRLQTFYYIYTNAMTTNKSAIYTIGGATYDGSVFPYIFRYDLNNLTSVTNLTASNPSLSLPILGAAAQALPDGKIVIAFGLNPLTNDTYPTNQVVIFDTMTNTLYNQPVNGTPPLPRGFGASAVGPDQTTIYYYGGSLTNYVTGLVSTQSVEGLVALNTTSWEWIDVQAPGLTATPFDLSTLTLFESAGTFKFLYYGGGSGSFYANYLSVLNNIPRMGQSLLSSGIQWFTNVPYIDSYRRSSSFTLSDGAKAGIALGVFAFLIIALIISYKLFPPVRHVFVYIQNEIIWNPRIGEPLWTETLRLVVRFICFTLLVAFLIFLIIRAATSPIVTQHTIIPADVVQVPDIRFCFDGFGDLETRVTCQFSNGTFCNQYIIPLDTSLHTPTYYNSLPGDISCFLFLPGPSFYLGEIVNPYDSNTLSNLNFQFFTNAPTVNYTQGVIHMDLYPPNYDPNIVVYNLLNDTIINLQSSDDIKAWKAAEYGGVYVPNSHVIKQTTYSGLTYQLVEYHALSSNGWNYIGLGSVVDKTTSLNTVMQDAIQNTALLGTAGPSQSLATIAVQPESFTRNIDNEQKVFTLLNTLAQAGGVFGLIVVIQTLLFGFRPQSPWGVVHRWAFGTLKVSLTDRLANQFDKLGTPVPLVNPVNSRLSVLYKDNDRYSKEGPSVDPSDDAPTQEMKLKMLEERLQFMELVLKSYYLNDEIFRSIDQAVKRNNEVKRRSGLGGGLRPKETDSVLENDFLNEDIELRTTSTYKEEAPLSNVQRRPSSTVFPRDVYQPKLASPDKFQYHDDT